MEEKNKLLSGYPCPVRPRLFFILLTPKKENTLKRFIVLFILSLYFMSTAVVFAVDKSSFEYTLCKSMQEDFNAKIPVNMDECISDINAYIKKYTKMQQETHHKNFAQKKAKTLREKPKVTTENKLACIEAVRNNSKYPSKANIHYMVDLTTYVVLRSDKWKIIIKGGADLMNDLGNMIPHRYHCEVSGNEVVLLEVSPG